MPEHMIPRIDPAADLHDPLDPLRRFVDRMTRLVGTTADEARLIDGATPLLHQLIAEDSWLPEACAQPHPEFYQQYLLHCDPLERFCLVSFVWGPGQRTPIHDHQTWGLIGVLRGAETGRRFRRTAAGLIEDGLEARLEPGGIDVVSPRVGDIHQVANAFADRTSISIHLYGGNIGAIARHVFDAATGAPKPFVSGYSSPLLPNLWDRSAATRSRLAAA
ncbi:MAG: cysteine dioxygenase [Lautropia sp.]